MKTSLSGFAEHLSSEGPRRLTSYIMLCMVLPAAAVVLSIFQPVLAIMAGIWVVNAFTLIRKRWREYAAGKPATRYSDG